MMVKISQVLSDFIEVTESASSSPLLVSKSKPTGLSCLPRLSKARILTPFLTLGVLPSLDQVQQLLRPQKLMKKLQEKANKNKKRNKHHPHPPKNKNKTWIWETSSDDSL